MLHVVHAFESEELPLSKFGMTSLHHLRVPVNAERPKMSSRTQTNLDPSLLACASDLSPGSRARSILVSIALPSKLHRKLEQEF